MSVIGSKPFSKAGVNFFKNDTLDKLILDKHTVLWVKYRCINMAMKSLPLIPNSFIHTYKRSYLYSNLHEIKNNKK
jgi:hypothetical protein